MKKVSLIGLILMLTCSINLMAAGEGEDEGSTLQLMFYSPELQDQYNDMVEAYKADTGVNLEITVLQTDYRAVLTSKINSGDIPDIFMSSAYADNSTYRDYVYDLSNESFMDKIEPAVLTGVTVDGKIIGYPFLVQSHSFIYNKAIFRDLGLEPPTTISELEDVAKKLEAADIQPFATGFKEYWVLPQTAWQVLAPYIPVNYGGFEAFVNGLNSNSLDFADVPEMEYVFDVLDIIGEYGGPKPNESDFTDQTSSLAVGKVGIIHQGNWAEGSILGVNPDAELGFFAGPTTGEVEGGIMFDSNQTIRVAKDGKNLQAALDWLEWLTTSDYGRDWVPGQIKQTSPIIGAGAPDSQIAQATTGLLGSGVPGYPWFYQMFPTGTEQQLGTILQGYCAGLTDREETLAALDAAYDKIAGAQ